MEHELVTNLDKIRKKVAPLNSDIILTGILATLHKRDLDYDNLTPLPRYRALMDALKSQLIGEQFELRLTGIDEILVKHNTPMLEACNTSFQVHLQVTPDSFVKCTILPRCWQPRLWRLAPILLSFSENEYGMNPGSPYSSKPLMFVLLMTICASGAPG